MNRKKKKKKKKCRKTSKVHRVDVGPENYATLIKGHSDRYS